MRSVVYAQIKNAIRDGFPDKATSILKSHRYCLSKSELDKIFYLGMWNGSTLEWFTNNIDEYRSYPDKHCTVMCNVAYERKDTYMPRGNIKKMLTSFESFKKYGNKNEITKTLVDMLGDLSSERKSFFLECAIDGNCHKLIKRILKSARPGEVDLQRAFDRGFDGYLKLSNRIIDDLREKHGDCREDRPFSRDHDAWKFYDLDSVDDLGRFETMRIIYQRLDSDEKKSCVIRGMCLCGLHGDISRDNIRACLILKQKWIDFSGIKIKSLHSVVRDIAPVFAKNKTITHDFFDALTGPLLSFALIRFWDNDQWRYSTGNVMPNEIAKNRAHMLSKNVHSSIYSSFYSVEDGYTTNISMHKKRDGVDSFAYKKRFGNSPIHLIGDGKHFDFDTFLAFSWAYQNGHSGLVKKLLTLDRTKKYEGNELTWACTYGAVNYAYQQNAIADIVDILMDCGADPSANDSEALRWIAISGNMRIAERLLDDYRTNVSANDHEAVKIAYANGHYWLCKELRQKLGSDVPEDLIKYYEPRIEITDSMDCDVDDDSEYFDDYPDNRDSRLFSRPLRGIR